MKEGRRRKGRREREVHHLNNKPEKCGPRDRRRHSARIPSDRSFSLLLVSQALVVINGFVTAL